VKNVFGQIWPRKTLYVKSRPAPWLDVEKKRIQNVRDVFYTQTKFPSKTPFLGGTVYESCMLLYVCFAAQIRCCCESD